MARFFIDRPIFAWVIAIVIMLAGLLSIETLPVSQYPTIAPPTIAVTTSYPGASAKTLEDSVTQIIEQRMKGLDGLLYMGSTSDSAGNVNITLTFSADTDPDIAQVQVQNKLQSALSQLPQAVQQQGVTVAKSARNFLMVVGFISEDGSMKQIDLADYLAANVIDPVSRVEGVGEVQMFGSQYAMRIWMDPTKLASFQLTPGDVSSALQTQNVQVSAGQLGGTPAIQGQQLNATINVASRLQTPEQFENIILRTTSEGRLVRLGDVARAELGSENYSVVSRYNGMPAAGMAVRLAAGSNALSTANSVKAKIAELEPFFPASMKSVIPYDTTPFVKISIEEVVWTLVEAVVLVFLVMWLFLQNIRATLIPTIAVPVVLLGTFGVLAAFGYSINVLTMFGLVLAIGLLVDDAIVVVENVERVMSEEGLSPYEATKKSMDQITGALVGIGLVLSAVFVPMAFFGGSTGVIYRQFSITIVSAMALSVIVALVLTPALCSTLLKPVHKGAHFSESWFFRGFNRLFDAGQHKYANAVQRMLGKRGRYMVIYLLIVVGMGVLFVRMPTAFLPDEDQGVLFVQAQLPAGATQERTLEVLKQMESHFRDKEADAVQAVFTVAGFSFGSSGQNAGLAFVMLKDWKERNRADLRVKAVAGRAMMAFMQQIRDGSVFAFAPPAVMELGNASGFDLQLQDRGGIGHQTLLAARNRLLGMAMQEPRLTGVRPNGMEDMPEFRIDVDSERAMAMGLAMSDINTTLSTAWGSSYINDFVDKGRIKRVYIQAEASARMSPEDLDKWFVRNDAGKMVPFSAFAKGRWDYGSPRLERYNGVSSMNIVGQPVTGVSTGEAMALVEEMAAKLPPGVGYEWTGISYEERQAGSQAPMLYAISLLVVFLCLAALYESWSVPFSVMLVVPLGVIGALLAAGGRGLSNDVFFQVGLLTTVGLASKNAILIVEFARHLQDEGMDLIEATMLAVRQRLRPILMTSLAFGLGVVSLVIASGAGSGGQNAIGTGVLGGMLSSTILGIFFVPVFFVVVRKLFKGKVPRYVQAKQQAKQEEEQQ
ncbi:MAG: hydrophobe/amphiphile efflux-1 family RND transporter [Candidatus Dactylopiibacterium carminicum]|nr:MAG: hydrophobe/amphiphile efflux-1 family RND transporter [Candidatus Dactylopiibacterium carminicum]